MTAITNIESKTDFRAPSTAKRLPRAVADAGAGVIIAVADIDGPPEAVFRALTTDEIERWWAMPGVYRSTEWQADLRVCGAWSVVVVRSDGAAIRGFGEFAELAFPHKIVMTRNFDNHPFLGPRETTITYCLEPIAAGTRLTVRDEGFIGRSEAAYGNAEIWEKVLGWLDAYVGATEMRLSHGARPGQS